MEGPSDENQQLNEINDKHGNGIIIDKELNGEAQVSESLDNITPSASVAVAAAVRMDESANEFEDEAKGSDKESSTDKSKEKRDNESSATSTSSSDDESETSSSEDKIESSIKPEDVAETTLVVSAEKKEKKEEASKNDDTTDDSDIDDDLVSTINYNTITSLAALKDMLQCSGEDSDGVDSFFHHYFLSHVNRLPSRNQTHSPYPWGRRLSECREEDEYETEERKWKERKKESKTIPTCIIHHLLYINSFPSFR